MRNTVCLAELLKKNGFRLREKAAGLDTAFVAEWGSGRPIIGYMGEFDALPGLSQEADCLTRKPVTEGGPGQVKFRSKEGFGIVLMGIE